MREIKKVGGVIYVRRARPMWLRRWVGDALMEPFDNAESVVLQDGGPGAMMHNSTEPVAGPVCDATMSYLGELTELEYLHLDGDLVTDDGVAKLKRLTKLKRLYIYGCPITDAGIGSLKGLTNLNELVMTRTSVTDDAVADLQRALPNLEVTLEGEIRQSFAEALAESENEP